ncbi:uncharacterized protein sycp2 [Eucyclogobius newberryi]|uniref:uncharacterized protein sycp2 n=1 Tax=Eucyclogobius newberryi TaxID=166745 RepID=UPI003B5A4F83
MPFSHNYRLETILADATQSLYMQPLHVYLQQDLDESITIQCSQYFINKLDKLICKCLEQSNSPAACLAFTVIHKCGKNLKLPGGQGLSALIAHGLVQKMLQWFEKCRQLWVLGGSLRDELLLNLAEDFFDALMEVHESGNTGATQVTESFLFAIGHMAVDPRIYILIQKEAIRKFNLILDKCPIELKKDGKLLRSQEAADVMSKLANRVLDGGDYDFQTALMEALCRMATCEQRKQLARRWFTMEHVSTAFVKIRDSEFETDCRKFLNLVNGMKGDKRSVFSYPCLEVYLGFNELLMPTDEKLEEFWIDFNIGSHSISFYFSLPDENAQEGQWETLCINETEVSSYTVKEEGKNKVLTLNLSEVVVVGSVDGSSLTIHFCCGLDILPVVQKVFGHSKNTGFVRKTGTSVVKTTVQVVMDENSATSQIVPESQMSRGGSDTNFTPFQVNNSSFVPDSQPTTGRSITSKWHKYSVSEMLMMPTQKMCSITISGSVPGSAQRAACSSSAQSTGPAHPEQLHAELTQRLQQVLLQSNHAASPQRAPAQKQHVSDTDKDTKHKHTVIDSVAPDPKEKKPQKRSNRGKGKGQIKSQKENDGVVAKAPGKTAKETASVSVKSTALSSKEKRDAEVTGEMVKHISSHYEVNSLIKVKGHKIPQCLIPPLIDRPFFNMKWHTSMGNVTTLDMSNSKNRPTKKSKDVFAFSVDTPRSIGMNKGITSYISVSDEESRLPSTKKKEQPPKAKRHVKKHLFSDTDTDRGTTDVSWLRESSRKPKSKVTQYPRAAASRTKVVPALPSCTSPASLSPSPLPLNVKYNAKSSKVKSVLTICQTAVFKQKKENAAPAPRGAAALRAALRGAPALRGSPPLRVGGAPPPPRGAPPPPRGAPALAPALRAALRGAPALRRAPALRAALRGSPAPRGSRSPAPRGSRSPALRGSPAPRGSQALRGSPPPAPRGAAAASRRPSRIAAQTSKNYREMDTDESQSDSEMFKAILSLVGKSEKTNVIQSRNGLKKSKLQSKIYESVSNFSTQSDSEVERAGFPKPQKPVNVLKESAEKPKKSTKKNGAPVREQSRPLMKFSPLSFIERMRSAERSNPSLDLPCSPVVSLQDSPLAVSPDPLTPDLLPKPGSSVTRAGDLKTQKQSTSRAVQKLEQQDVSSPLSLSRPLMTSTLVNQDCAGLPPLPSLPSLPSLPPLPPLLSPLPEALSSRGSQHSFSKVSLVSEASLSRSSSKSSVTGKATAGVGAASRAEETPQMDESLKSEEEVMSGPSRKRHMSYSSSNNSDEDGQEQRKKSIIPPRMKPRKHSTMRAQHSPRMKPRKLFKSATKAQDPTESWKDQSATDKTRRASKSKAAKTSAEENISVKKRRSETRLHEASVLAESGRSQLLSSSHTVISGHWDADVEDGDEELDTPRLNPRDMCREFSIKLQQKFQSRFKMVEVYNKQSLKTVHQHISTINSEVSKHRARGLEQVQQVLLEEIQKLEQDDTVLKNMESDLTIHWNKQTVAFHSLQKQDKRRNEVLRKALQNNACHSLEYEERVFTSQMCLIRKDMKSAQDRLLSEMHDGEVQSVKRGLHALFFTDAARF